MSKYTELTTKKEIDDCLQAIAAFAIALITIPISVVLTGWALSILVGWFLVPLGFPTVGLWHAAGISAILQLALRPSPTWKADDDVSLRACCNRLLMAVFAPLFAIALGFVLKSFM